MKFSKEDFKGNRELYLLLLKNGTPMALMNSVTAVGCMAAQGYVNQCGAEYTTAYSVCSKYLNLFMLPALTAGFAASSFVSQNYGAGKTERIRQGVHVCIGIVLIAYVLLGAVMVFLPKQIASFILNELGTIALTAQYMKICGVGLILLNLLFIYRNVVQGMGYPMIPMMSGIAEMVLRIPTIIILLPMLGFRAVAYAEIAAWIGALSLNFGAYVFYSRKLMNSSLNR